MIRLLLLIINSVYAFNLKHYYMDPRIHSMGNHGPIGKIHADIAPIFTKIIDKVAYNDRDIRKEIINSYNSSDTILDLCCGVGLSTPKNGIGIDTSYEMISKARKLYPDKQFDIGNAESYYPNIDIDVFDRFLKIKNDELMLRKTCIVD